MSLHIFRLEHSMLPSPRPAAPSHHSRPAGGMVISGYGSLSRRLLQSKLPYRFVHRTRNSSTSVSSIPISLLDRSRHDDAPRLLRPRPLAQGHGPARVPRARGGRLGEPRRARVRGRDAWGVREGLRGVPGHVPARAHGAQRGRGPRPCAVREGTAVSCQVDGTRPDESPAGRRPGSAAVLPRGRDARRRRARARHAGPRGVRGRRGASSAWRTRCARGPRASWRASGGPAGEARPLPRLVPVGRADEGAGRRQGGHPVGPGGDGGLRQHAVRPREGAAAVLVLLGG